MAFDPRHQLLHCASCHSVRCPEAADKARPWSRPAPVAEIPYRGVGNSTSEQVQEAAAISCPSCGAEHAALAGTVASNCPFCTTPLVGAVQHVHTHMRPTGIVPFSLTEDEAHPAIAREVASTHKPRGLKRFLRDRPALIGTYAAFYTFDATLHGTFTAERGSHSQNNYRIKTGSAHTKADDALIAASDEAGVTQSLAERAEPRQVAPDVQPYREEYLAGFQAALPTIGLTDARDRAHDRFASIFWLAAKEEAGHGWRITELDFKATNVTWKLLLLPVWLGHYRCGKQTCWIAVNGSNGTAVIQKGNDGWTNIVLMVLGLSAVLGYLYLKMI